MHDQGPLAFPAHFVAGNLKALYCRRVQELAGMSEACDQARLGIQERDFLIATRKRSENAIITQASNLTSELQQASAALDGLYQRSGIHWASRESKN